MSGMCLDLQVLIWSHSREDVYAMKPPVEDTRIVQVVCDELQVWRNGSTGKGDGKDIWELAEDRDAREEEMVKLNESGALRWIQPY